MSAYPDKNHNTRFCEFYHLRSIGGETFANVYEVYIHDVETTLKRSTLVTKKNIFQTWILPQFGKYPIEQITPADIRSWQCMLMNHERNYKKSYICAINTQLNAFFKYVDRIYGLPFNPCQHTGPLTGAESREREIWTLDEYRLFAESIRKDIRAFTCFEVLYWTGIREGELLALSRDDIHPDSCEIRISKTYLRLEGEDVIQSPKTKSSRRTIRIPDFLCRELREYLETAPPTGRVFPVQRHYLEKKMRVYSQIAGVRRIRIHSLRRSAVSLLVHLGCEPIEISRRMGHGRISVTLDIYADLFPERQIEIASKLDQMHDRIM